MFTVIEKAPDATVRIDEPGSCPRDHCWHSWKNATQTQQARRAFYRLGRQAGVGEGQVEDVAGGGAAVGRVVAPLVVEHQPAPLLVHADLGMISSPVALHGQRRTTLRGDADAEMRNLSATISLPS